MHKQLARIGLDYNHPKVKLFPASRPDTAGEFPNIGTRGCFLSHLNILKNARIQGHNCILILEDDADFTSRFCSTTESDTALITKTPWDMFYLGSQYSPDENADDDFGFFTSVLPIAPLKLTHSTLLRKTAILEIVPYLEIMLTRKIGDPLGDLCILTGPIVGSEKITRTSKPWPQNHNGLFNVHPKPTYMIQVGKNISHSSIWPGKSKTNLHTVKSRNSQ